MPPRALRRTAALTLAAAALWAALASPAFADVPMFFLVAIGRLWY